jgi:hypothetical protein
VNPISGVHTQNIEMMWGSAKWGNKKRIGTKKNFPDSYLAEFMWRTKFNERDPFKEILKDGSEFWPSA